MLSYSKILTNAVNKHHPVLVFDNFVNLGPEINIVYIGAKTVSELDKDHPSEFQTSLEHIQFGGLLLYLCEGKINIVNHLLPFLNFVNGATLCLITRDCKSLSRRRQGLILRTSGSLRLRESTRQLALMIIAHYSFSPVIWYRILQLQTVSRY